MEKSDGEDSDSESGGSVVVKNSRGRGRCSAARADGGEMCGV